MVAQGLSLKVFVLFSDFKARELRSIPAPSMVALMRFFHANTETNVHPSPVSWYFIFVRYGRIYVLACI